MPADSYTNPFDEPLSSSESPNEVEEDVGLSLSDNENDLNDGDDEAQRIRNIGDENPHLMAYLDNSDSNHSNAIATSSEDEGDDLDDLRIEASEEQAIRADYSKNSAIPGPVSLRRLSQSHHSRPENARPENANESDDSDSDLSSWGNDFLEDYFDLPTRDQHALHHRKRSEQRSKGGESHLTNDAPEGHSDDDSHLWQYFFSSDDDDGSSMSPGTRARQRRLSRSKRQTDEDGTTDDEMPLKGKGPLPASQIARAQQQQPTYIPSGDSTDEDDGVPPEHKRRRARSAKAIEVLGSNSFSARPPLLGSWRIKDDKNVGIIDGLTTRTLSPPSQHLPLLAPQHSRARSHSLGDSPALDDVRDPFEGLNENGDGTALGDFTDFGDAELGLGENSERKPSLDDAALDEEVSDLDLLELGDFINTESLSSDENDHQFEFDVVFDPQQGHKQHRSPAVSPYLYRNRMSARNAPISAFRNRGSPYVANPAFPADNFSPVPRRGSRRSSLSGRKPHLGRDAYISPSYSKKRGKRTKPQEGTDLIGELIEIGAISPLFEIDQ